MRIEQVEIYSDETNTSVMRHPGRHFPGVLIQGDTLYAMCTSADTACDLIGRGRAGFAEANKIRNSLWALLNRYKAVLDAHHVALPFSN
jgi:hypothetical protein